MAKKGIIGPLGLVGASWLIAVLAGGLAWAMREGHVTIQNVEPRWPVLVAAIAFLFGAFIIVVRTLFKSLKFFVSFLAFLVVVGVAAAVILNWDRVDEYIDDATGSSSESAAESIDDES
ncbi:MAG: hypothetical protein AAF747_09405 [Planctomycetota bacterium]